LNITIAVLATLGVSLLVNSSLKIFGLKVPIVKTTGLKQKDSFLIFALLGMIFLGIAALQLSWDWLVSALIFLICDLLLISKKHYAKFASQILTSRAQRQIAGVSFVVLLAIVGFAQSDAWSRQIILNTGEIGEGVVLKKIDGHGKYRMDSLVISYTHPRFGSVAVEHSGPFHEFENISEGEPLRLHYDQNKKGKIALDGLERGLFSALFLFVFFGGLGVWCVFRLTLPNKHA